MTLVTSVTSALGLYLLYLYKIVMEVVEMKNLDAFKLKWIAIIGMLLNHMVIAWWEIIPTGLRFPLYAAGGLTFPIMAYFVVEGYRHTANLKRYLLRLFIIGLIAVPFHVLAIGVPIGPGYPVLNIMFSIILSLIVLVLYDKIKVRALFWVLYVLVIAPISLIFFEWYFIGITMVLLFYIIRNENARRIIPPIFAGSCWLVLSLLSKWSLTYMEATLGAEAYAEMAQSLMGNADFALVMLTFAIGCILAALLLKNFNGERGKRMKWFFYIFYPLHLAVLAAVALALGLINLNGFGL